MCTNCGADSVTTITTDDGRSVTTCNNCGTRLS